MYNYIACFDAFHPSPVADPEGVQGDCSNPLTAPVFKYAMKMK